MSTKRLTTEEFILRAKEVHGDKFDYSKVKYINTNTKVIIGCDKHGYFEQRPGNHLKGAKCFKCKIDMLSELNREGQGIFLESCKEKHNGKYDYSKVVYKNSGSKIEIVCPTHGSFWQFANAHKAGRGCLKCYRAEASDKVSEAKRLSDEELVQKLKRIHGDQYDYTEVKNGKGNLVLKLSCKQHGPFKIRKKYLLAGGGCPSCYDNPNKNSEAHLLNKCREVHGDAYEYDFSGYENNKTKLPITCTKHGVFYQNFNNHISLSQGCPNCKSFSSKGEDELATYIEGLGYTVIRNTKKIIGQELDIFLPDLNLAVEYNGEYWHSTANRVAKEGYLKMKLCESKGIKLITIRDQEYKHKKDAVLSVVSSVLNEYERVFFPSDYQIESIENNIFFDFLEDNDLGSSTGSSCKLGIFSKGELLAVTAFSEKGDTVHIDKYVTKNFTEVLGGLRSFITFAGTKKDITISIDNRWEPEKELISVGFEFDRDLPPDYQYLVSNRLKSKYKYAKSKLVKQGFDKSKTEKEIMEERGIPRLYDCGRKLFKLKCK